MTLIDFGNCCRYLVAKAMKLADTKNGNNKLTKWTIVTPEWHHKPFDSLFKLFTWWNSILDDDPCYKYNETIVMIATILKQMIRFAIVQLH